MDITENDYKTDVKHQLVEAHARVVYTYTAHHKDADYLIAKDNVLRISQIILTAISASGFFATIISNQAYLCIIAGLAAAVSLGLNLYTKDFKPHLDAQEHKSAADELWLVREQYISLITDLNVLDNAEIIKRREAIQNLISDINKRYKGTSRRGYKKAQKALKKEEEQFFNEGEAEQMLPAHLRKE